MPITDNAVYLQISKLTQVALAFIASIFLARTLGPTGVGQYTTALTFAVLMQGLTSFGLEDLTLARGPLVGGSSSAAYRLYAYAIRIRLLGVILLLCLGGVVLFTNYRLPFDQIPPLDVVWALCYAALNSFATLGAVIQYSQLRAVRPAFLDGVWSVLVTASYGLLVAMGQLNVQRALAATVVAQLSVDLGYLWVLKSVILYSGTKNDGVPSVFRPRDALMFWLNGLLSIGVAKNSDILAMGLARANASAIGLYNAAYNLVQTTGQMLLLGTGNLMYVGMGRKYANSTGPERAADWEATVVGSCLLSLPLLIFTLFFASPTLLLLYGPEFQSAAVPAVILAAFLIGIRVAGGGGSQALLFLAGRQMAVLVIRTLGVTVNIVLDILLYKALRVPGVSIASGGCGVAISIAEHHYGRRVAPIRYPVGATLRLAVPFGLAGLGSSLLFADTRPLIDVLCGSTIMTVVGTFLLFISRPLKASHLPDDLPRRMRQMLLAMSR
jgi:O-antigen/teichoic acid export membrane protein